MRKHPIPPTRPATWLVSVAVVLGACFRHSEAAQPLRPQGGDEGSPFADEAEEQPIRPLPDPLKGLNRAFFHFNDRLYFWVIRPAASGYRFIVPREARIGLGKFFANLAGLRRAINCAFQGHLGDSGRELARFGVNTTVGVLGLTDPAKAWLKLRQTEADFGQTLGVWGMGPALFLTWPLIGPSTLRDTLALPLDAALDPATFIPGAGLIKRINHVSLNPGEYEDFVGTALDPYTAVRDAYHQHREHLIRKRYASEPSPKASTRAQPAK